jgi:UDP-glucose 4-epimerase
MATQRIMVVGGSGFIGQHVTRALAALGHEVYATHGQGRAMPALAGVIWVPCDLSTSEATAGWPACCDTVFFLAQARQHRDFPSCTQEVFSVNVAGLHQTLIYASRAGAQRLVYASTGSVYSRGTLEAHEQEPIDLAVARNYYVASKLASEILLGPFADILPVVVLRLFMPYGAGQKPDMLFPQLCDKVRAGKPIYLHGPEGLRANPVAVADVAETCTRCLALQESVTMNVAGPEVLSLRQIGAAIGCVLGRQPVFQVVDQKPPSVVGSTARLRRVLDWFPSTRLEMGLRHLAAAYPLAG